MVCSSFFNEGVFMNVLQCDLKKCCSLFFTNLTRLLSSEVANRKSIKWLWLASYYFCLCLKLLPTRLKGHDRKAAAALGYSDGLVYTPCAPAARMLVSVCTSCRPVATPTVVPDSQSERTDGRKRARTHADLLSPTITRRSLFHSLH